MNQNQAFNYEALDGQDRKRVRDHAQAIHTLLERTAENVINIGRHLNAVRDALGRQFATWLRAEFRWSQSVASNYMRAAEKFGNLDCAAQFQPSALYELARDRVDERAVAEAIEQARAGEVVTSKTAHALASKYGTGRNPDALHRLRHSLKSILDGVNDLTERLSAAEVETLADQLLDLAMKLRGAVRQQSAQAAAPEQPKNPKGKGSRRRQTAAA